LDKEALPACFFRQMTCMANCNLLKRCFSLFISFIADKTAWLGAHVPRKNEKMFI
jgi:hypothetical protein